VERVEPDGPEDFASFYEQSRDSCLHAVHAAVGDATLAEDLTAEAFAKAFAAWRKVRRHPAPQAWVVRVALNTGVSWWRKRRHEVAWNAGESASGPPDGAVPDGPELLDARIFAALHALPQRQREVVVLRFFLDLDTAATAQALGISVGAVKSHLSRAAAALRRRLGTSLEQESVSR
jgi:RNA polymerase sigma-70 factor (sigma-E family)